MRHLQLALLAAALLLPATCAAVTAVAMTDSSVRSALRLAALVAPWLLLAATAVGILYAAGLALTDIARRWHRRQHVYPDPNGMYPLVRTRGKHLDWFDATPDAVKAIAAWTHAQAAHGVKPSSAATRAAMSVIHQPAPPALPAPDPEPAIDATWRSADAFDVDPARSPHVLIVGKTGSGKSTLARHLLGRFVRRHRTEVLVCDPDGVNWLDQCSATTTDGIAAAINAAHGEFARRQEILADGGAPGWPYLILLMEETETVFERLSFSGDKLDDMARFQMREIARMGRKAGVFLWAVTQVAGGDVFDLHVRRNMSLWCALSEPSVGRMLGVPKEIDLTRLAPGQVFASATGDVMTFPSAATVHLPLSPLYNESQPQPVVQPVGRTTAISASPQPVEVVGRIDPGRRPSAAEAAAMRTMYQRGASLNSLCARFYGYKDQTVLAYVREATGYQVTA